MSPKTDPVELREVAPAGGLSDARPLPWYVQRPYDGCDGHMQHSVWDADGNFVCECDGEDEGYREALEIADAMNRAGPRICECGKPAACFGSYEDELNPAYACDDCCGHGNEDGHCELVAGTSLPELVAP